MDTQKNAASQFDYASLLPPLTTEEMAALEADLKANKQLQPIYVDEDGNVLDGRHRMAILGKDAKTKVIPELSEAEKKAFVFRSNFARRNLSGDEKKQARKIMKAVARELREEDANKWTLKKLEGVFGVDHSTVARWYPNPTSNSQTRNTCTATPDGRTKVPAKERQRIAERIDKGDSQVQIASDYGVSQQAISNIKKKKEEEIKGKAQRKKAVAKIKKILGDDNVGVLDGDFREIAKQIPDSSVDLIFTDPPWDRESLDAYYADLGQVALDKLIDGGSILVYTSQAMIYDAITAIIRDGLKFYWTCAEYRPEGPHMRMNRTGKIVKFIPILWFVKGRDRYDTSSFVEDCISTPKPDKKAHVWQQSIECAEYYIGKLSPNDGLIFDPFCGGGTTSVAANRLGRNWITCDVDSETVAIARERVVDANRNYTEI